MDFIEMTVLKNGFFGGNPDTLRSALITDVMRAFHFIRFQNDFESEMWAISRLEQNK